MKPLATPDFTPAAIVAVLLGIASNAYILFGLDVTDERKAAISGLITTGVAIAFLAHDAVVRHGRANVAAAKAAKPTAAKK